MIIDDLTAVDVFISNYIIYFQRLEFSLVKLIDQLELLFLRICISERVYPECTQSTFQSQEYSGIRLLDRVFKKYFLWNSK